MALAHLHSHQTPFLTPHLPLSSPTRTRKPTSFTIHCGPRSNRGPLVKGRVLSTEAIQAVQALKRAHKSTSTTIDTKPLSRLIKSDLLATLRELLRQQQCDLALSVFSTVRSEPWYTKTDLSLYADLISALQKEATMGDHIDRLIEQMEEEIDGGEVAFDWGDKKGLSRVIKGLINAERRESTVRIYGVMRKCGWGCTGSGVEVDEYVAKVLSKGLKRFGQVGLANEVEGCLQVYLKACLDRGAV